MRNRVILLLFSCIAILVVAGVLSAGTACAHDPRFACSPRPASSPVMIPDPVKSWAFYGRIAANQEDHYAFAIMRTTRIPIGISVDVRDAVNPARPFAALYDANNEMLTSFGLSPSEKFYEPFSRVTYVSSKERLLTLPPGRFAIVVSMRGGQAPQRYTLAIGSDERFNILQLPYIAGAIYRIHARRY